MCGVGCLVEAVIRSFAADVVFLEPDGERELVFADLLRFASAVTIVLLYEL